MWWIALLKYYIWVPGGLGLQLISEIRSEQWKVTHPVAKVVALLGAIILLPFACINVCVGAIAKLFKRK